MKVSKCFNKSVIGCMPEDELANRATGRTTAIAFFLISKAMSNPCTDVYVHDHHCTIVADKLLFRKILEIAQKEGLDWFTFNPSKLSINYNPYH